MSGEDWRDDNGNKICFRRETNVNLGWHKILTLRDKYNLKIIKESNNIVEFTGPFIHGYYSFRNNTFRLKEEKKWYIKLDKYLENLLKQKYFELEDE